MLSILVTILCIVGFIRVDSLTLSLAWGAAKIIAVILAGLAIPVLVLCIIFASGIALFTPLVLLIVAFAIVRSCVR